MVFDWVLEGITNIDSVGFPSLSCIFFASIRPKALKLNFYYELFLMFPHYKNLLHNHVRAGERDRPAKGSIKQISVSKERVINSNICRDKFM